MRFKIDPSLLKDLPTDETWVPIKVREIEEKGLLLSWRKASSGSFEFNLQRKDSNVSLPIEVVNLVYKEGHKRPNHRICHRYGVFGSYPGQVPRWRGETAKFRSYLPSLARVELALHPTVGGSR